MSLLTLFVALWLLTMLAGEHLLANRGIVLGQDLPRARALLIRFGLPADVLAQGQRLVPALPVVGADV